MEAEVFVGGLRAVCQSFIRTFSVGQLEVLQGYKQSARTEDCHLSFNNYIQPPIQSMGRLSPSTTSTYGRLQFFTSVANLFTTKTHLHTIMINMLQTVTIDISSLTVI